MDLINRQDAIDAIDGLPNCYNGFSDSYDKSYIIGVLEELPSEEQVIRCRDCRHWYLDADTGMACEFTNMSQPEDGFCNWAERRTDEQAN